MQTTLTLRSVETIPVFIPLKRPVVSKVGFFDHWPVILINLYTEEGIVGHSYLEPYLKNSCRYIMPAIEDLAAARKGKPLAPMQDFIQDRASLGLVGYAGMSMIAAAGLDMAAWDALAKAANLPLANYLGGSIAPVPAYNSNGLWLTELDRLADEAVELVAEGVGALRVVLSVQVRVVLGVIEVDDVQAGTPPSAACAPNSASS